MHEVYSLCDNLLICNRVLDGQHRLAIVKLAGLLDISDKIFPQGFSIAHWDFEVLRYGSPAWVAQALSLQKAMDHATHVSFSPLHTSISLARQQVLLENSLGTSPSHAEEAIKARLVGSKHEKDKLFRIATYSDAVQQEIEYACEEFVNCLFTVACNWNIYI